MHLSLIHISIDGVKIDRSIVIESALPRAHALLEGMIRLSHDMGIRVLCEGVEDIAGSRKFARLQSCQKLISVLLAHLKLKFSCIYKRKEIIHIIVIIISVRFLTDDHAILSVKIVVICPTVSLAPVCLLYTSTESEIIRKLSHIFMWFFFYLKNFF